jgi:ribosome-associated protein
MLRVTSHITIPLGEFRWEFARSGGPGGQNVNKVSSKAALRWNVQQSPSLPQDVRARLLLRLAGKLNRAGELRVTSQQSRDQRRNMADCLEKVRRLVLAAARPPRPRKPTGPTTASRERRLRAKLKRSETKRLRRNLPHE